jgi:hypothetical protein
LLLDLPTLFNGNLPAISLALLQEFAEEVSLEPVKAENLAFVVDTEPDMIAVSEKFLLLTILAVNYERLMLVYLVFVAKIFE